MKILPLSAPFLQKRNTNSPINNVSIPVRNHSLQKDTVSFSGSFLHDAYNNLNETLNKQILPFIDDSKGVYQSLIDINNDAGALINKISEQELNFISKKADLADLSGMPEVELYKPYVTSYDEYKRNLAKYANLKLVLQDESYSSKDMQEALKKTENILFQKNPELNKIKPLYDKYKETQASIELYNSNKTLKNSDSPLKEKLQKINENRYKAAAYALLIPLPETFMMLRSFKEVTKELQHPTQSMMKTLTTIEHLQQSAETIVNDIEKYNIEKPKVSNFIDTYNKNKANNPSVKEIENTYESLTKDCENNARNEVAKLTQYYNTEYVNKGIGFDCDALDRYLKDCNDAIESLYNKKKEVDQKLIEENNKKFFDSVGLNSSEELDD